MTTPNRPPLWEVIEGCDAFLPAETCNRRLDKFTSVTSDQLEVLAEIFSETDRADKISLHCDPVTRTVTIRYEDLDDGWFNDLCNIKSSLNS